MDIVKPADIVAAMIEAGASNAKLGPTDLLIRGALSGALFGVAASLAIGAAVQTGQTLVGALIFPAGFVMIVLLELELVSASGALVPLAVLVGRVKFGHMLSNWSWVLLGNLIGSVISGVLFVISSTNTGHLAPAGAAERVRQLAEAKTIGYAAFGDAGMLTVFVRAVLSDWMVCMGVVMGFCSTSTVGRILAMWLPLLVFFAQGFEHTVVNMFIIPAGMIMGAKVSISDWLVWNLVPVTIGNAVGGFGFVALALFVTYARKPAEAAEPSRTAALVQTAES